MSLLMEPGQTYNSWDEFKVALDTHSKENKVIFNVANAKTVEQSNAFMKRGPLYDPKLKYTHCVLQCKHYGSYASASVGLRPKQRSYKIDCRAFISVSACRKENYLIIRDSYHKHSHPCTEEIYNSYPEVRRMTRDERRMVGTLLDMGVPVSQIKSAVGKNVTQKDLHNAKVHMRAVKMGLKSEEPKSRPANKRDTFILGKDIKEESQCESEEISAELVENGIASTSNELDRLDKDCISQVEVDPQMSDQSENITLSVGTHETVSGEKTIECSEAEVGTISSLLNSLNANSESVITVASSDSPDGDKSSYTVIVSSGENEKGNSQVVANLQELFSKLQNEGIKKSAKLVPKSKLLEQIQVQAGSSKPEEKNCENCGKYMSPLDGHGMCLICLGPQHLHQHDCEHCNAMKPEQLNIRRKLLVRMRMKALKEMNESKQQHSANISGSITTQSVKDNAPFQARKSKRQRKPKDFGPDISVQDIFASKISSKSPSKVTKCVVNDGEKEYMVEIPKREVDNDFSSYPVEIESSPCPYPQFQNTERFQHLLKQTSVLDDVVLKQSNDGVLSYEPDANCVLELNKAMSQSNISGIPSDITGKYSLDSQFESAHCSIPSSVDIRGDTVLNNLSSSIHKLAQNATMQTRLSVYDKLFTRLGVGMADEALGILSHLYGKVTQVTEISQEDLTNDLQTALDTIQALKDVLEELGMMSKDAFLTAAHQRSISLHSLDKTKKALKRSLPTSAEAPSVSKRSKFEPFTKQRLTQQFVVSDSPSVSVSEANTDDLSSGLKFEVEDNAASDNMKHHIVMEMSSLPSDISPSVLAPIMTVSPMSISGELLERLQNQKEGIIELSMVKEDGMLHDGTDASGTIEVQEVIQHQEATIQVHTTG